MYEFDELMRLTPRDGGFRARIPDDWMQGRAAFGGLVAAMGVRAMREVAGGGRPLSSLDVAFVAPVGPGEAEVRAEVLRAGRYVTHAGATIRSGAEIAVRVHGVFAAPRSSRIRFEPSCPEAAKPLEAGLQMPFVPGLTPVFTRHFDYRLTEGDPPFTSSTRAVIGGFVRHRTAASGIEAVVALLDAWPSPVLSLGDAPFLASTVRWSVHVLADPPGPDEPLWFRSECVSAGDGYATFTGRLCAERRPIAWTEQLVALFDA